MNDDALGRLVRFEGLTYKEGTYDGDKYPQYLETTYPNGSTTAVYENKYYAEEGLTPTYAYSYGGNRYYGSSWFAYDNTTSTGGNYILRVSGYSNFALQPLLRMVPKVISPLFIPNILLKVEDILNISYWLIA